MTGIRGDEAVVSDAWTRSQIVVVVVSVLVGLTLRWVGLGTSVLTFDEAFTADAASLAPGELFDFLAERDSHPPLDYLLRAPFSATGDELSLRLPSAVVATLTLLCVALWMRGRGWFGVAVVAITAVVPIEVLYARQARMYALLFASGTLAAIASERWLASGRRVWVLAGAAALLVGLASQNAALVLVPAMLLIPGLRRDTEAWWWRGAVAGATAIHLVVWGPYLLRQIDRGPASWIPSTNPGSAADAVGGQIVLVGDTAVGALLLVAGGVLVARRGDALGRTFACLAAFPVVALLAVGVVVPLTLPRTLGVAVWGVGPALAALGAWVLDRSRRRGPNQLLRWAVVVAMVALVIPSIGRAVTFEEDSGASRRRLAAVLGPGDAVAVVPGFLAPILRWDQHPLEPPDDVPVRGDLLVVGVVPGAPPSGRVWVLVVDGYGIDAPPGSGSCAEPAHEGDVTLWCLTVP